jgi:ADP-dependent NAD(P)H-hydrate dehydratase / NAD(P)H-hydrate epimerase
VKKLVERDRQNFFTFSLFHFFTFLWQFICDMQKVLTAEEMREVDRLTTEKYGIPSILLMENAAHAAARIITEKLGGSVAGKSFLILCGKGNNGGDGAALARILWTQGADTTVYLFGKVEETKGDARVNFEICQNIYNGGGYANESTLSFLEKYSEETLYYFTTDSFFHNQHDCVIDALFGTGITRKLEGIYEKLAQHISHLSSMPKIERAYFPQKPLVISIDLPSGLNADNSHSIGKNTSANLTITFTAPKLANVLPPASNYNGELFVVKIGSREELIVNSPSQTFLAEKSDAQKWLEETIYTADSYKNKRGHALLIVGSKEYTGAAVLAGNAAMLSGVGLTTIATSESAQNAIAAKVFEEIIVRDLPENEDGTIASKAFETVEKLFEKVDVVGIGCGLGLVGRSTGAGKGVKNSKKKSSKNVKRPLLLMPTV